MPDVTMSDPPPQVPAADPAPPPPPPPSPIAPPAPSLGQRMDVAAAGVAPDPTQDGGGGAAAPPPAAESNWQGVRDFARTQGVELPYDDDGAALSALLNAHRQLQQRNYYADVGQRMAPYAAQVREMVEQRRRQQQAPAPQPWAPPEFNKAWLQQVERDEATGLLRSRPGYDPAVADKAQAYLDWRERFLENPETVVAPLVEARAQALIDARFAEHQQRASADRLVAGHAPWMFAAAPGGGRQLTPEGTLYAQAAKVLWDRGLRDVQALDAAATAHVESAVLRRRYASEQQQRQQQPPPALPGAVGGNGVRPAAGLPAAAPPSSGGLSLRALLNQRLNGVVDDGVA